jgi:putative transposase
MEPGLCYHIFNHANGRENLFVEQKNYSFFLRRLEFHVLPVCRLYAYCLMKNHFHSFVRIRTEKELRQLWNKSQKQLTAERLILKTSKAFSNLFSSYTQSFNSVYNRMGSLFVPSMKTEYVEGDEAFKRVVHYIHRNPVHHGFVTKIDMWKHSSYNTFLNNQKTSLDRDDVLKVFGGIEKFVEYHSEPIEPIQLWQSSNSSKGCTHPFIDLDSI